jgi:hypothetical protein
MNPKFDHDECTADDAGFNEQNFDSFVFQNEEWALCDTELESTVNAAERVPDPNCVNPNWIINALEPEPDRLFDDTFLNRLKLLFIARVLASYHHRLNRTCSFGLAARWKNYAGETLEEVAPDWPKAATGRFCVTAESLASLYKDVIREIDVSAILEHFDGKFASDPELKTQILQLRDDTDVGFWLMLDISTDRAGRVDPMHAIFDSSSPDKDILLRGHNCRRSLNRLKKFLDHVGMPEKRTQEDRDEN